MNRTGSDQDFIREYQARFEKKMRENEIAVVEFWKAKLDKLIALKPEGIAALQLEMKKLSTMMENRMEILKKG